MAQFFENLSDYWPLVNEIAASYSKSDNIDDLWLVFQDFLELETKNIKETKPHALPKFQDEAFNSEVEKICANATEARVNFWTSRVELFRLLSTKFVGLAERKHRFLISTLLEIHRFIF